MADEELDIIELQNDEGETLRLRVARYFYYNGEEYVLLTDDLNGDNGEDATQYIMRVSAVEGDEEMEEFVPIDDEKLLDKLEKAVKTVLDDDDFTEDDD